MVEPVQPGQIYEVLPDGRWAMYMDASMTGTFGVCPQLFQYQYVRNLTPKGDRPWARDLGSWWSVVMEHTYGAMFQGKRLTGEELVSLALRIWNELNMEELDKIHPKMYKEFGGKAGAVTMIAEYAERQLPIDYVNWKILAAEASFGRNREVKIGETNKIILYWMGQPDLFVIANNSRVHPVDHKSISKIDNFTHLKYKPHIQLPGYIIAAQIILKNMGYDLPVDRVVVNACARTDSTDKKTGEQKRPRFKRFMIGYTQAELEEWKVRRIDQASRLREYFESGRWPWNEYACGNQWGRPCPFQQVDDKTPETREIVLQANFMKRAAWIPGRTKKEEEVKVDS
jgi:hypothetical protein